MIGELAVAVSVVKGIYDVKEARQRLRAGQPGANVAVTPDGHSIGLIAGADGVVRVAEQALLDQRVAPTGLLHGEFIPADEVSRQEFSHHEPALVAIWDVRDDPELNSLVLWCPLGETFQVELPEGIYATAALVFEGDSDIILGGALLGGFELPAYETTLLTLAIEATGAQVSRSLVEEVSPLSGELVLPGGGEVVPLHSELTLGRAPDCDVICENPRVSWRHALIQLFEDGYLLYDLDSSNGTHLNGMRVESAMLGDGDVISIAGVEIGVRIF